MGSGGVRASCQSTLCILAGISLGLALLCLLCGGILYGVSSTFTKMSHTHVNTTTASKFSKKIDSKLDNLRSGSAKTGAGLLQKAHKCFYSAGGLGIVAVIFLFLACGVAYKSRPELAPPITSVPNAPAPDVDPTAPPVEDAVGDATSPVPPAGSPLPPGSPPPPPGSPLPLPGSSIPDRAVSPVM